MTASTPAFRDPALPVDHRVEDLLARLSLDEKIDQLHQGSVGNANPNNLTEFADQLRPTYGSFILGGTSGLDLRNALQRRCVEESRLGIPAIFGADVIHGYRTLFPIPLGQSCSWDLDLMRQTCRAAAEEAAADGIDWTFAPMIDIALDPRWGRVAETFGESPFAASAFCRAAVEGYQQVITACLKHFAGYGESEGGRDYSATDISPQRLWELHLPPYEAGVRAGARTVMSAFNDLNGIPTSAHRELLTDILRLTWGFRGFVVSDWNAVLQLLHQGFAADESEAAQRAILAGVDLNMADGLYRRHLGMLVTAGRVPVAVVDEAVRRVLRVKFETGLFEHPYRTRQAPFVASLAPPSSPEDAPPSTAFLALANRAAARSIVLLKNSDRVLPLSSGVRRLAVIGPLAGDQAALRGSWYQHGRADEVTSIAAGFRERAPADIVLQVDPGCSIAGDDESGIAPAAAIARDSDVVVLCLGETTDMSGENASRAGLRLPGRQQALADAIIATGKPVVLVLVSGRPLDLTDLEPRVAAILAAWQPGSRGGTALADIVWGRQNPSARLSLTWPRNSGQIPLHHHLRPRARTGREGEYQDIPTTPLYPFGHGLSFTTFRYDPIRLSAPQVRRGETLVAEVSVANTGDRDGVETVFWFIRDPAATITRPLRELKHFSQHLIRAGESVVFRFEIEPLRDLSYPDASGKRLLDTGVIQLFAADQAAHFQVVS